MRHLFYFIQKVKSSEAFLEGDKVSACIIQGIYQSINLSGKKIFIMRNRELLIDYGR